MKCDLIYPYIYTCTGASAGVIPEPMIKLVVIVRQREMAGERIRQMAYDEGHGYEFRCGFEDDRDSLVMG